jgi:hypothetical protein
VLVDQLVRLSKEKLLFCSILCLSLSSLFTFSIAFARVKFTKVFDGQLFKEKVLRRKNCDNIAWGASL